MKRRAFLAGAVASALPSGTVCGPVDVWSQEAAKTTGEGKAGGSVISRKRAGMELMTAETKRAVERGQAFLARKQIKQGRARGSFGRTGYAGGVAVCGLAGLAFMSGGSVPGRGPYGKHVQRCVEFLMKNTDARGYISAQALGGLDQMYGHGFATLFLSEAYGMSFHRDRDEGLGKKLRAAVNLIVQTQNNQGGWRYQPRKSDADLSITICQIMALRAARDAGINVPNKTRELCINYVKKSKVRGGGFSYTMGGGHSSFPLAAAGVVALNSAGVYDGAAVEDGLKFINRQKPKGAPSGGYYFYGQYYAAQAMWHAGGKLWSDWYKAIRSVLIRSQRNDGSWIDGHVGAEFGTAMACIILQLPRNFLPVFSEG